MTVWGLMSILNGYYISGETSRLKTRKSRGHTNKTKIEKRHHTPLSFVRYRHGGGEGLRGIY